MSEQDILSRIAELELAMQIGARRQLQCTFRGDYDSVSVLNESAAAVAAELVRLHKTKKVFDDIKAVGETRR